MRLRTAIAHNTIRQYACNPVSDGVAEAALLTDTNACSFSSVVNTPAHRSTELRSAEFSSSVASPESSAHGVHIIRGVRRSDSAVGFVPALTPASGLLLKHEPPMIQRQRQMMQQATFHVSGLMGLFDSHNQAAAVWDRENMRLGSEIRRLLDAEQELYNAKEWLRDQLNQRLEDINQQRRTIHDQEAKIESLDHEKQSLVREVARLGQSLEESRNCSVTLREQLGKERSKVHKLRKIIPALFASRSQEHMWLCDRMANETRLKNESGVRLQDEQANTSIYSDAAIHLQKKAAQQSLKILELTAANQSLERTLGAERESTSKLTITATEACRLHELAYAEAHDANETIDLLKKMLAKQLEVHLAKETLSSSSMEARLETQRNENQRALTALNSQWEADTDSLRTDRDRLKAKVDEGKARLTVALGISKDLGEKVDYERKWNGKHKEEIKKLKKEAVDLNKAKDGLQLELDDCSRELCDSLNLRDAREEHWKLVTESKDKDILAKEKEIRGAKDEEIKAIIARKEEEIRAKEEEVRNTKDEEIDAIIKANKDERRTRDEMIRVKIEELRAKDDELAALSSRIERVRGIFNEQDGAASMKRKATVSPETLYKQQEEQEDDEDSIRVTCRRRRMENPPKRRRTAQDSLDSWSQ